MKIYLFCIHVGRIYCAWIIHWVVCLYMGERGMGASENPEGNELELGIDRLHCPSTVPVMWQRCSILHLVSGHSTDWSNIDPTNKTQVNCLLRSRLSLSGNTDTRLCSLRKKMIWICSCAPGVGGRVEPRPEQFEWSGGSHLTCSTTSCEWMISSKEQIFVQSWH